MDIINTYRTFIPEHQIIHSVPVHMENSQEKNHMLGQKTSLNKFKKTEIITSILSDHNALKLENKFKKEVQKPTNM